MDRLNDLLSKPISIAPLVFFRIGFALVLLIEGIRYWFKGLVHSFWVDPEMHFSYPLFQWLPDLPGSAIVALYALMGVLLVCIILGFFYRVASILFFILISYFFLLDQTPYLNHFYLFVILSFLLTIIPANQLFSLDVKQGRVERTPFVPAWSLWIIRFMLAVVYFYGGIAKLNGDWLQGEPMYSWLKTSTHLPIIGPFVENKAVAYFFTYGGLALDLCIVPFLLWPKTRKPAFIIICIFHIMNSQLFTIGMFPIAMILLTLLFFSPESFRQRGMSFSKAFRIKQAEVEAAKPMPLSAGLKAFFAVFVLFHLIFPLRHYTYPGDASWTEEGHNFAWRMMLRKKVTEGTININDAKSGRILHSVNFTDHMTIEQKNFMLRQPEGIRQFCTYLRDKFEKENKYGDFSISTRFMTSFNGREKQLMVKPDVDLSKVSPSASTEWIMPMKTPLYGQAPQEVLPKTTKANSNVNIQDFLEQSQGKGANVKARKKSNVKANTNSPKIQLNTNGTKQPELKIKKKGD